MDYKQVYAVSDERLGEVVACSLVKYENSKLDEAALRKFCEGKVIKKWYFQETSNRFSSHIFSCEVEISFKESKLFLEKPVTNLKTPINYVTELNFRN